MMVVLYLVYAQARDAHGDATIPTQYGHALRDARQVLRIEQFLHLRFEHGLQQAVIRSGAVVRASNVFYGSAHFLVTAAVLVWLFRRHPERYAAGRNVLLIATGVALIGFVLFPVAPPRMLPPGYGFTDTLHAFGGLWTFNSGVVERIADPFAAMPSLHLCWATWCTAAVFPSLRTRPARATALAYPLVTAFVVVATGNHYVLDLVGGVACFLVGAGVCAVVGRWPGRRRANDWPRVRSRGMIGR